MAVAMAILVFQVGWLFFHEEVAAARSGKSGAIVAALLFVHSDKTSTEGTNVDLIPSPVHLPARDPPSETPPLSPPPPRRPPRSRSISLYKLFCIAFLHQACQFTTPRRLTRNSYSLSVTFCSPCYTASAAYPVCIKALPRFTGLPLPAYPAAHSKVSDPFRRCRHPCKTRRPTCSVRQRGVRTCDPTHFCPLEPRDNERSRIRSMSAQKSALPFRSPSSNPDKAGLPRQVTLDLDPYAAPNVYYGASHNPRKVAKSRTYSAVSLATCRYGGKA